jgi:hypothetical protein
MNEHIEPIRIHPLDLAKMINDTPTREALDVYINKNAKGEREVLFAKTGKRYIEDIDVPVVTTEIM